MARIIWLQGGSDPQNGDRLQAIAQWWATLEGKEVTLAQRLLPASENPLENPQIVGTTVGENYVLRLRDRARQLEIQLTLDPEHLKQLKQILP